MEWKPIKTAPANKRILVVCRTLEGGSYSIFEAFFNKEENKYFVPCPKSKEDRWITLVWTPLWWHELGKEKI